MPTLSAKLTATLGSVSFLQRPFSAQRGGQRKRNLKCFGDMLEALSGGDPVSLLRAFFFSREGRPLLEQLDFEPKDISQGLVEGLRSLHASAPSHEDKRAVLKVVSPVFSRTQLWERGFRFSSTTLTRALKSTQTGTLIDSEFQSGVSNANANAQSAVPNGQPSPPTISNTEKLVRRFLEGHSREAANRMVALKRKECNDPDCVANHNSKKRYVQLMVDWLLGLPRTAKIYLTLFLVSQVCCPCEVFG
jgi:hypothetical protein